MADRHSSFSVSVPRRPPLSTPLTGPRVVDERGAPANDHVYGRSATPDASRQPAAQAHRPATVERLPRKPLRVVSAGTAGSLTATTGWRRGIVDFTFGRSTFTYALIASLVIHGVLLAIKFRVFDLDRTNDRGPPLEVALVNAKSAEKPVKAEILAQANLDGGGNTDEKRRIKSPLPIVPKQPKAEELVVATEPVETRERRTKEVMTQSQGAPVATAPAAETGTSEQPELPSTTVLMQKTLEVMRLEAQIAKDMDGLQKKPRRKHVGASAEEYRFARYVEDWRQKVERIGNLNYPEAARQLKLYGNLILTVSIRADGSIEKIVLERSSGRKVLDAAAIKIVELAAPYARFPKDIERDIDYLDITRTWTFAKGDELRSE